MNRYKRIMITVLLCMIYVVAASAQNVNLDEFDKEVQKITGGQHNLLQPNGIVQLIVGLGYKQMLWSYDASRPSSVSGGSSETIGESSTYDGIFVQIKSVTWRPIGLLVSSGLYFPLKIRESIHPKITDNGVSVVTNTSYVLKNMSEDITLKGIGFQLLAGPNYEFNQGAITINIGGGVTGNFFAEDLGETYRQSGVLGIGVNIDLQLHITNFFGISIGILGNYYPLSLYDMNNKVENYSLKTLSMSDMGAYIATGWYF